MAKAPTEGKLSMVVSACNHDQTKTHGKDRHGNPRVKCVLCNKTWTVREPSPLGAMRIDVATAKLALRMLTEGMSIRATERTTGLHRDTICRLMVFFGQACQRFMDQRMRGLSLTHLEFE